MFPTRVGQYESIYLFFLVISGILLLVPFLIQRRSKRLLEADKEVFSTAYDINTTYDMIVKEVEGWRRRSSNKRSFNPLKWGRTRFHVYKSVQPRLYRVVDGDMGIFTFELTPIDGGGASVKISYPPKSQFLVEAFKAKLPVKIFASLGKVCSSCGKVHPPSYTHCPYCSIALQ